MLEKVLFKIRQSYWVKSGTIVIGTRMALIILGFIGFLLLIRYLDKDEYGIWVIFMTISGLIETVRVGFIKNPLMILHSDKSIDKKSLYNSSFFLNISLTILIIIIILIVSPLLGVLFENQILKKLFYLYVIKLIVVSVGDHIDIVQEANFDFKGTFLDLFMRSFIFVLSIVFCFLFTARIQIYHLVIFQIVGAISGVFFSYRNSLKKKIKVLPSINSGLVYLKKLMSLGKFTFGSSASSIAMRYVDTWMLGALINPVAVAIYNPAIRISNIFELPTSTMTTILMPKLTSKINLSGQDSVKYYYEKSMSHILIFMIPIVAIGVIFSNEIIFIVAGEGFEQTGYLLKFTMFYGLLIPFNRQFSIMLDALGKPKLNFIVILITLILSVILNIVFITQFGIIGAIYGTLISYSAVFIFTQIYLYRKFNVSLLNIFYKIIPGSLLLLKKLKHLFS